MEIPRQRRVRLIAGYLATILFANANALASTSEPIDAERDWANTGTDFNTGNNWTGGIAPGVGDVAWFKVGKITNPNLTASVSIAGLYFGDKAGGASSSGYDITASSASVKFTLTGTASTTGGIETSNSSAAAIGADNTSGTNTIDAGVVLGGANNSTQTFFEAGGGTLIINGAISSTNTVRLSLNGAGTFQLAGNNTYNGGTTLASGVVLNVNSSSAIGTGALTFNGNATIDNTSGTAITLTNNNSIALSGGSLTFTGTKDLSFGAGGITMSGNNRTVSVTNSSSTLTIAGIGQDASPRNLTKAGAGTLVLSGTGTYTGATAITGGTLNLAAAGAIGSTSSVVVNSGGTLLLSNGTTINHINDSATMILNGGTFNTGGVSEHGSVGIGALTLSNSSIIDLGNGASIINFANSSGATWISGKTLTILDWSGSTSGGGTDQLIFGLEDPGLTAAQIAQVVFHNPGGFAAGDYSAIILGTGELVPFVPESGTWVESALALALICYKLSFVRRPKTASRSNWVSKTL